MMVWECRVRILLLEDKAPEADAQQRIEVSKNEGQKNQMSLLMHDFGSTSDEILTFTD